MLGCKQAAVDRRRHLLNTRPPKVMTLAHVIVSNARPHASTAATAMPPIMPIGGGGTQGDVR